LATDHRDPSEHRFFVWRPNSAHQRHRARYSRSERPGIFGENPISPLDSSETNHALHIGIEHRFNDYFAVFGRAASAFRTPNVDERVGASPIFDPTFTIALPGASI